MGSTVLNLEQYKALESVSEDVTEAAEECAEAYRDIHNESSNDRENMIINLERLLDAAERARDEADTLHARTAVLKDYLEAKLSVEGMIRPRFDGYDCGLVDGNDDPVDLSKTHKTFRGEEFWIIDGEAPQTPASTGKLHCRRPDDPTDHPTATFYPSVFGMRWAAL